MTNRRYTRLVDDDGKTIEKYRVYWWVRPFQPTPHHTMRLQAIKVIATDYPIRRIGVLGKPRKTSESAISDGKKSGYPAYEKM